MCRAPTTRACPSARHSKSPTRCVHLPGRNKPRVLPTLRHQRGWSCSSKPQLLFGCMLLWVCVLTSASAAACCCLLLRAVALVLVLLLLPLLLRACMFDCASAAFRCVAQVMNNLLIDCALAAAAVAPAPVCMYVHRRLGRYCNICCYVRAGDEQRAAVLGDGCQGRGPRVQEEDHRRPQLGDDRRLPPQVPLRALGSHALSAS